MFLDINGNSFSILSNQAPVITHNPLQLFGSDLKVWVDFTDKSTLFTDTACTTNVTTYGDYILGIRDKSLNRKRLNVITFSAQTDYQWSSNTFNTLGGCLRTKIQTGTGRDYNGSFTHEDATFLTSNTNYSIHFVARIQGGAGQAGLYAYSFNNNVLSIISNAFTYTNATTIQSINSFTNLYFCSIQFYFNTEQFESIRNSVNIPIVSSSTAISYTSGKLALFQRFGTSPQNVTVVQGFYCQEIYFVQGTLTTEQLNLTQQYLKLKYS